MLNWITARMRRKRIAHNLYDSIVALSRSRVLYADLGLPDTVEGRFELLAFHLFACLDRLSRSGIETGHMAQDLVDIFFADMDSTSRQLGVGDTAVPKKMRQLAAVFEERMTLYREAAGKKHKDALAAALAENIFGQTYEFVMQQGLTSYVCEFQKNLAATPIAELEAGRIRAPGEAVVANGRT